MNKLEETYRLISKKNIIDIDTNHYKSKKEILYYYILCFINMIYLYLFHRKKDVRISIKEDKSKINIKRNCFYAHKNISRKDLNYKLKNDKMKKKYKKNIKRNNIMKLIMIIAFNSIIATNNIIDYKFSNITLKVKGPGYSYIFTEYRAFKKEYYPHMIYINGIETSNISYIYYFGEINNTVKLVWWNQISNCNYMFRRCSNITEIDLSDFLTSRVTNMNNMFFNCSQLISLDLSNFDTSNVIDMQSMFKGCSKLTSLNLSSFYTSEVTNMISMFSGCSQLISLDLSSFYTSKVNSMAFMFFGCSQLISLDLSNFDTSNVIKMEYMFYSCSELISLNLSNFINSKVDNMAYMFYECSKLISLDLSNFYTPKVSNMNNMFRSCSQLSSLDLSQFDTSNVKDMSYMFCGCSKLSYLDLSNFCTSKVTNMEGMFYVCLQLTTLNLSSFDTSNVTNMNYMFYHCSELTTLNLSNFKTSKVKNMNSMFSRCLKLTSLNLSNFETSEVINMENMFTYSAKLEYINLKNFEEHSPLYVNNIFKGLPENIVVCLNDNSIKILEALMGINCYTIDCTKNWELNQKKIVNKTDICFNNYNNNILYKYKYNGLYYEHCINGSVINNSTIKYCQCETEKCNSCSNISDNIYEIENNNYLNGYRKCYKDPIGYYFDTNESIYKKCYFSCKKCEIKGNNITHNCIECNNDYSIELKENNYSNCYKNISNNDLDNNNIYTDSDVIEFAQSDEMKNMKENISNCLNDKNTRVEEIKCYDSILQKIEDFLTSENYDITNIDNGNNEIIDIKKVKVIFTTTKQQKDNINMTKIDLGECEILLRHTYNLLNDEILYIKILEIFQEEMRIPKIEYGIYSRLNGELTKLNLTSCTNRKIYLSIPADNIDDLNKLNSKSRYYNDICYISTTKNGIDIPIKDRINEYPYVTVCQDDCDFIHYNFTSKRAKCSCEVREFSTSFADMYINKEKLLYNFIKTKNVGNFNILICSKILFSIKGIIGNIGFYILITIIIYHIITVFVI